MKRKVVIALALPVVVLTAIAGGAYALMSYIEYQRVRDATPAFLPLNSLNADILSTPLPFERHCHYWVDFTPNSSLTDDNIEQLLCLNALPAENHLTLMVSTPHVTDKSVPVLGRIKSVDILDATASGISDIGITKLAETLPDIIVGTRKNVAKSVPRAR